MAEKKHWLSTGERKKIDLLTEYDPYPETLSFCIRLALYLDPNDNSDITYFIDNMESHQKLIDSMLGVNERSLNDEDLKQIGWVGDMSAEEVKYRFGLTCPPPGTFVVRFNSAHQFYVLSYTGGSFGQTNHIGYITPTEDGTIDVVTEGGRTDSWPDLISYLEAMKFHSIITQPFNFQQQNDYPDLVCYCCRKTGRLASIIEGSCLFCGKRCFIIEVIPDPQKTARFREDREESKSCFRCQSKTTSRCNENHDNMACCTWIDSVAYLIRPLALSCFRLLGISRILLFSSVRSIIRDNFIRILMNLDLDPTLIQQPKMIEDIMDYAGKRQTIGRNEMDFLTAIQLPFLQRYWAWFLN